MLLSLSPFQQQTATNDWEFPESGTGFGGFAGALRSAAQSA